MTTTDSLLAADRHLQAAQLAADADALDALIDDRLIFTGPDGRLYSKQDDLDLQRSGQQRLTEVTEQELTSLVVGTTGVTWFLGRLAGPVAAGRPFQQPRRTSPKANARSATDSDECWVGSQPHARSAVKHRPADVVP